MSEGHQIPGFSPEQTWAMKQVIKEAVTEANARDERVTKLEACVYGNGRPGLDKTMTLIEKDVASLVWYYRGLVIAVLGSWLTLLVKFVSG